MFQPARVGTAFILALVRTLISYSEQPSEKVADALVVLIDGCIQGSKPWTSRDFPTDQRWTPKNIEALADSPIGIACVTRSNQDSPDLLMRAGAIVRNGAAPAPSNPGPAANLAAAVLNNPVPPPDEALHVLLIDLEDSELTSPLRFYPRFHANKNEVRLLLDAINKKLPASDQRTPTQLTDAFDHHWGAFETAVGEASKRGSSFSLGPAGLVIAAVISLLLIAMCSGTR